jgi:putative membrane protein
MKEENRDVTPEQNAGKPSAPAPASTVASGAGRVSVIRKILSRLESALGLVQDDSLPDGAPSGDVGTQLAHQRTDLALNRSYLAAERTLMAWIRTSLSMISFGFTIGKIGQIMGTVEVKGVLGKTKMMSVESIAYYLVILGTLALLLATLQHWLRVRQLYVLGLPRQVSIPFFVSLLLIVVGGFALSSLVMAL